MAWNLDGNRHGGCTSQLRSSREVFMNRLLGERTKAKDSQMLVVLSGILIAQAIGLVLLASKALVEKHRQKFPDLNASQRRSS
jgi:hypothetical protein